LDLIFVTSKYDHVVWETDVEVGWLDSTANGDEEVGDLVSSMQI
jgi:hypothetical protein